MLLVWFLETCRKTQQSAWTSRPLRDLRVHDVLRTAWNEPVRQVKAKISFLSTGGNGTSLSGVGHLQRLSRYWHLWRSDVKVRTT